MSDELLSPQEIMDRIPEAFQADKAQGLTATFQFEISGERGGTWHVRIQDGQCQVAAGSAPTPDISLAISDDNFVRLITGRLDGTMAFLTGKLKLRGDMALAMRLSGLFRVPDSGSD
ncbi:MAG: SCP2 sterol-binding domain-containing protein [Candidatus Dormibacteria bacterium]